MMIVAEYKTTAGEEIVLGRSEEGVNPEHWEVTCWDKDGNNRWHKDFNGESFARAEFDRWRS